MVTAKQKINRVKAITNCTYNDLSEALDMTPAQISNYITGRFNPNPKSMERIDRLYNGVLNDYQDLNWGKVVTVGGIVAFLFWIMGKER